MLLEVNDKLIEWLTTYATRKTTEEKDGEYSPAAGGNFDDAYGDGVDGYIIMSRMVLDQMNMGEQ